jgi:molybdate/tungstate transport system substrate-binding protein
VKILHTPRAAATRDASPPPGPVARRRPAAGRAASEEDRHLAAKLVLLSVILALAVLVPGVAVAGCSNDSGAAAGHGKTSIRILYAGSLIIPFAELEKQFEALHPDIAINGEGHGSIQVLRHVSDIHEEADVLISADSQLIPMLLYGSKDPDTGKAYGSWRLDFATNEMAVAYTDKSKYASEVTAENWYDVLGRPDVRLGLADPRFDSNGYRAVMMFALAGRQYDKPALFFDAFDGQFTQPVTVDDEGAQTVIHVPEILETSGGAHIVTRGYSVQLLPLLESGDIDYAIEYLSVIKQHGLKYVTLPPELNLGDEALAATYNQVRVDLDYQRFASVKPSFEGQPITYSLTIPSNAAQPKAASLFVQFLLGADGRRIMEQNYHPMLATPRCDNLGALPQDLRGLLGNDASH